MDKTPMDSPTIKDIARRAQVSPSTVSRVINGKDIVKESTQKKVMQVIEETNFFPNKFAQGLMNKKSNIIGVVVPWMRNPFYAELVSGIDSVLYRNGYSMLLCDASSNTEKQVHHLKTLVEHQVEGIIIINNSCRDKELLDVISRKACIISVQTKIPGCDCVSSEEANGLFAATDHLLNLGHRRIAYICFLRSNEEERLVGFTRAFEHHGLPYCDELILSYKPHATTVEELVVDAGRFLTNKLLEMDDPPTAILATSDFYAIGAYHAIKEKGLKIPEDISVCGFDDIEISRLLSPPMTTVKQFIYDKGKTCGELLIQRINGDRDSIHREIVLPTSLVVRSSTAPPKR